MDLDETISQIEADAAGGKCFIGKERMLFLANDSNSYLRWAFGDRKWTHDEVERAKDCLEKRHEYCARNRIVYLKCFVPEKASYYRHLLPTALEGFHVSTSRPSSLLSEIFPAFVVNLLSYGRGEEPELLYFRGDSHPNWFGAFKLYREIILLVQDRGFRCGSPVRFSALTPSIASYSGDLFGQMAPALKDTYENLYRDQLPEHGCDLTLKLELKAAERVASRVDCDAEYSRWFTSRESVCYDGGTSDSLPRVVVFRDSTLDFCHDLIAQHFSRSVFIWNGGRFVKEVVERESPDLIIHVMAERFSHFYSKFEPVTSVT